MSECTLFRHRVFLRRDPGLIGAKALKFYNFILAVLYKFSLLSTRLVVLAGACCIIFEGFCHRLSYEEFFLCVLQLMAA